MNVECDEFVSLYSFLYTHEVDPHDAYIIQTY